MPLAVKSPRASISLPQTLEEYLLNPPQGMEWVDNQLIEKTGMTLKHSKIQSQLSRFWGNYLESSRLGGVVYVEAPCRTLVQGRRPDVAYLTPELVAQFGELGTLPQSFSLIAEIASPDDSGEDLLAKAKEYLDSGCQEVWVVFPENGEVLIKTATQGLWLSHPHDLLKTQLVLPGFEITLQDLLT